VNGRWNGNDKRRAVTVALPDSTYTDSAISQERSAGWPWWPLAVSLTAERSAARAVPFLQSPRDRAVLSKTRRQTRRSDSRHQ
jgi:hypothetical protein